MKTYLVAIASTLIEYYYVEAQSEEQAEKLTLSGDYNLQNSDTFFDTCMVLDEVKAGA